MFIILFLTLQCASVGKYFKDRAYDARDVINIGLEKDIYGVRAFGFGIQHGHNAKGIGMRYGHLGFYKPGAKQNMFMHMQYPSGFKIRQTLYFGDSIISFNSFYHKAIGKIKTRNINKRRIIALFYFSRPRGTTLKFSKSERPDEIIIDDKAVTNENFYNLSYEKFSFELSLGMYLGFRIGLNLDELADFIVGFLGFDILEDDTADSKNHIIQNWEDGKEEEDNIDLTLSKYTIKSSQYYNRYKNEFHHCVLDSVCYNYEIAKNNSQELEASCNKKHGIFITNSLCHQTYFLGICHLSESEKIYDYYFNTWTLDSAEKDCKSLKGNFVK